MVNREAEENKQKFDKYRDELNVDNVLGHGGKLAEIDVGTASKSERSRRLYAG